MENLHICEAENMVLDDVEKFQKSMIELNTQFPIEIVPDFPTFKEKLAYMQQRTAR
jgi:hypothetical protein